MMRIFYAEDDIDDQELFTTAVKVVSPDAHVTLFDNGAQLYRRLKDKEQTLPDFLFLDLNMPVKSGFECLKEIRENPLYNTIRLIILTTSNTSHDIDNTYKLGADHYICKGTSYQTFKEAIQKAIHSGESARSPKDLYVIR